MNFFLVFCFSIFIVLIYSFKNIDLMKNILKFLVFGIIFSSCVTKIYTPFTSSIEWEANKLANIKILNDEIQLLSAAPQKKYAYFTKEAYKDFTIELEIFSPLITNEKNKKRAVSPNLCSIAFGIKENLDKSYQFQIDYLKQKFTLFYDGDTLEAIEGFKEKYKPNAWNKLKIDFVNSTLSIYLNNKKVLKESGLKVIKGKIALVHQGGHSKFYSFRKINFKQYKISLKK